MIKTITITTKTCIRLHYDNKDDEVSGIGTETFMSFEEIYKKKK